MVKKFILSDGIFKMSANVKFHQDLVKDRTTTKGGGRWHLDTENKILYLWDTSHDFGPANKKDIKEYLSNSFMARLCNHKVMYSNCLSDTLPELNKFEELSTII